MSSRRGRGAAATENSPIHPFHLTNGENQQTHGSEVGGMGFTQEAMKLERVVEENFCELDEGPDEETPSKKAPIESLTLTKLTSKRSRNDMADNTASFSSIMKPSRTVELPEPQSKII